MKATKVLTIIIAAIFISMGFFPMVTALDVPEMPIDAPIADQAEDNENIPFEGEERGGEVKLFFRGDRITPTRPMGNSSEEITQAPGMIWRGRVLGTNIGEWTAQIGSDSTASGALSISIWARSQTGAKNAGFRVNLYRSGGNMQSYFTNRQDVGPSPVKFTIEDTYNQQFSAGDTFDVQLVWLSEPNFFIGPSGGGEFLYGNSIYDSQVKVSMDPYPLQVANTTIPLNEITKDALTIKAEFSDYLHGDPSTFFYTIFVQGPVSASMENIGEPKTSAGSNSSSVSWIWLHKKDNAKNGEYTITVGISYENNYTITNTSPPLKIKLPGKAGGGGGFLGLGEDGLIDPMVLMALIVVVVIAVVAVVIIKRKKKSRKDDDEDEDEEN